MTTVEKEDRTITLMDGTVIEGRTLKISLLRAFMLEFGKIEAVSEDNDKSMDVLTECALIAMKQYSPGLASTTAELEELVDLPTVYQIIELASGIKLQDANALLNTILANK